MFSQILKMIPRTEVERTVKETRSEYATKGLTSWSQFVAMMFCQLGRAHSLREIEGGLKSCEDKLTHPGIEAPARSSLPYANRPSPLAIVRAGRRQCPLPAQVPLQEQTGQPGLDRDRPVPVGFRLGEVPPMATPVVAAIGSKQVYQHCPAVVVFFQPPHALA
ncbi:MAG: DUF4372 domain-containing protein [Pseudomonadota bacterium]